MISVRYDPTHRRVGRSATSIRTRVFACAPVDDDDGKRPDVGLPRQMVVIIAQFAARDLCVLAVVCERKRQHHRALERPGLGYALARSRRGRRAEIVVADYSGYSLSAGAWLGA